MAGSALSTIIALISALGLCASSAGVQMTIAGTAVQIAWGPLILIFLGIAAAIFAIVKACAHLENTSPEKKLEKAQQAADDAASAAD
jgi:large-conductance mechanosensitive channel